MPRTSPVHYIAPSAFSITPNANGQASDLAVYIARGTKIRVYSPGVDALGMVDDTFQEWSFAGRNRHLSTQKPYTIYARLRKVADYGNADEVTKAQADGYLVFVAKRDRNEGVEDAEPDWYDRYNYVTWDGLTRIPGADTSQEYWYIRLGDVPLPEGAQRAVEFDTGILGTDKYNMDWAVNPDDMPLRVEIGCVIDDEDAGSAPCVPFTSPLVMSAFLKEGWSDKVLERFDHWGITRTVGDGPADETWPDQARMESFAATGVIEIRHTHGDDDDFLGEGSAVFTVTAYGYQSGDDPVEVPVALVSAGITVYAETAVRYEIIPSTSVVSGETADDVTMRIRATDSRGEETYLTYSQFVSMDLSLEYAAAGDGWTALPIGGTSDDTVTAVLPISVFLSGRSVNVRLVRTAGQRTSELAATVISFVQSTADSKETEWIFLRSATEIIFGGTDSAHPEPYLIAGGQVNPEGAATGGDDDKDQDGWVPEGWWDEEHGTDSTYYYEYAAWRDYLTEDGTGHWGPFTKARIWHHHDGTMSESEIIDVIDQHTGGEYLSKTGDDYTPYSIGIGGNLSVGGSVKTDEVHSGDYSGEGIADTGWRIWNDAGGGGSQAVFDYLTVRKKMILNSLEVKETQFSAGDLAQSVASAEIARTDYYHIDADGNYVPLGYSKIKVPWLLRGMALVLGKRAGAFRMFSHYKKVRMTLTPEQLADVDVVRCYFLSRDGEKEVENWWRTNDLARCQTWNVVRESRQTFVPDFNDHSGNVYWWRKLKDVSWNTGVPRYLLKDADGNPQDPGRNLENTTADPTAQNVYRNAADMPHEATRGTYSQSMIEYRDGRQIDHSPRTIDGNTYHWFDVEYHYDQERDGRVHGWCDAMSDIPAAGDKVVQFGNTTDPDRMNIILSEVNGAGNPKAPDIQTLRGVYSFDLTRSWWGGVPCKMTLSPATGYEFYGPLFRFITEYGTAQVPVDHPDKYWSSVVLERDDDTRTKAIDTYPDYSDDIRDGQGRFVSRGGYVIENGVPRYGSAENPIPKNYVRKIYYYTRISHNGSLWLCSISETWYWRATEAFTDGGITYAAGDRVSGYTSLSPENRSKCEHVRSYATEEPAHASGEWTELVEKGDDGAFKSRVFCRSNTRPDAPSNAQTGGYNTRSNPVPPPVGGQPVWTDGAPDGREILWTSTAWFYSDGTHQNWTAPSQETDTETADVEFSAEYTRPSDPVDIPVSQRGDGTKKGTDGNGSRSNGSGQKADWYDPTADAVLPSGVTWNDMIWRAERRIRNGVYTGAWSVSRVKGESSNRLDIDNQADLVSLDADGKVRFARTVVVHARIFEGGSLATQNVTKASSLTPANMKIGTSSTVTVSDVVGGIVTITWNFVKGDSVAATTRLIALKLRDVEYSAVFSLGTTDSEAIYQVQPVPSEVSFSRDANNALTPASIDLKCHYTKATGSGTTAVASFNTNKIDDYNYLYYRSRTAGTWGPWAAYSGSAIQVASGTAVQDYEFCISSSSTAGGVQDSNISDREVVPVVKDGLNGGNAVRLALDNEHEDFLFDGTTLVAPSNGASSGIHLYDGHSEVTDELTVSGASPTLTIDSATGVPASGTGAPTITGTAQTGYKLNIPTINAATAKVVVKAVYGGIAHYAEFTGNKTNQDKYDLTVLPSSIAYNSATYQTQTISIGATGIGIGGTRLSPTISLNQNVGNLRVFIAYVFASGAMTDKMRQLSTSLSVPKSICQSYVGIYFELRWYFDPSSSDSAAATAYRVCDYETVEIAKAENGTSPWIADLDNEMDSIACDADDHPVSQQQVTTNLSLFYGSTKKDFKTAVTGAETGITVQFNNGSTAHDSDTVTVTFGTSATVSGKKVFTITLTAKDDGSIIRTLKLTVNGIKGDARYNLTPSDSSVVKSKSGTYTPNTLSCGYTKYDVKKGTFVTASGGTIKYIKDSETESSAHAYAVLTPGTDFTRKVTYLLYVGGVIVDRETVPIVSDGNDGSDAAKAYANPENISIPCLADGRVASAMSVNVDFLMKVGNADAGSIGVTNPSSQEWPAGVTVEGIQPYRSRINISTSATATGMSTGLTFIVSGYVGGKQFSAPVTVPLIGALQGNEGIGQRGKTGRFYYYAGEWSDFPDSSSWAVTDAQAPYFSYTTNGTLNGYYVFNPDENGTYTKSAIRSAYGDPSPAAPWQRMTDEFKYLITEAIFGEFAKFGASIMNGDYLMSQYVIAYGFQEMKQNFNNGTKYQYVDSDDMFGEDSLHDQSEHPDYFPLSWASVSNPMEVTSTSYTSAAKTDIFQMDWEGGMYTVEIEYHCRYAQLEWKIAPSASHGATANVTGILPKAYNGDDYYFTKAFFVEYSASYSKRMYFRLTNVESGESGYAYIRSITIRRAKFVPVMCIDMLTGKIGTNNIVARGRLHADGLFYNSLHGNENDGLLPVTTESIITLGKRAAGTTVILPEPSEETFGHIIEIFNGQNNYDNSGNAGYWYLSCVGMTSGAKILYPYAASNYGDDGYDQFAQYPDTFPAGKSWNATVRFDMGNGSHVKVMCQKHDGSYVWVVLMAEFTTVAMLTIRGSSDTRPVSVVCNPFIGDARP